MRTRNRFSSARGVVTGYVLKLVRESVVRSQEGLASDLGVDRATVQSWESGRRPFTSVSVRQALGVRHRLATLGANPRLLAMLDLAPEVDQLIEAVLDNDPEGAVDHHPLGWLVLTHRMTELVAWAVIGEQPVSLVLPAQSVTRRGPVPPTPHFDSAERRAFFARLRLLADRTSGASDRHVLLHRQACFLAGLDPSGETAKWLEQRASKRVPSMSFRTWSPLWPDARSVATSLARQGDPQPLRDFIARAHPDDACEQAGLNYWAYWVGEIGHRQSDDSFMIDGSLTWRGGQLLRHLTERLHEQHAYLDLNIHTLWALLIARRDVVLDDPALGRELLQRAELALDEAELSGQSRRELSAVVYGLRMSGYTSGEGNDGQR